MPPYDFSFVGRHKYSNSAIIALVGNDPQGKLYFETQVKSDRKWNNLIANFTGALHDPFAEEAHRKKAEDKILMGVRLAFKFNAFVSGCPLSSSKYRSDRISEKIFLNSTTC